MSTYHKGEKISDYYKIEEELGRYFQFLELYLQRFIRYRQKRY